MFSWTQVRDVIRGSFVVGAETPSAIAVDLRVTVDGEEEPQRVVAGLEEAFGEPWLVALADVCAEDELLRCDALAHNGLLALGALCLMDRRYVLRHAAPLITVSDESLCLAVRLIANEAARLRLTGAPAAATTAPYEPFAGPPVASITPFENYAE